MWALLQEVIKIVDDSLSGSSWNIADCGEAILLDEHIDPQLSGKSKLARRRSRGRTNVGLVLPKCWGYRLCSTKPYARQSCDSGMLSLERVPGCLGGSALEALAQDDDGTIVESGFQETGVFGFQETGVV